MAKARFLSDAERSRLEAFPPGLSRDDIAAYFTPTQRDLAETRQLRGDANRLAFGVGVGVMRLVGFIPKHLDATPVPVLEAVAAQLRFVAGPPVVRRPHQGERTRGAVGVVALPHVEQPR
ncbi:MAG: DUF4158 domain-containing protein [Rhodospirillaceae bacterium]|nr:DUF4158 domain-containing protein [Rhodospirillaceae bacterium]